MLSQYVELYMKRIEQPLIVWKMLLIIIGQRKEVQYQEINHYIKKWWKCIYSLYLSWNHCYNITFVTEYWNKPTFFHIQWQIWDQWYIQWQIWVSGNQNIKITCACERNTMIKAYVNGELSMNKKAEYLKENFWKRSKFAF